MTDSVKLLIILTQRYAHMTVQIIIYQINWRFKRWVDLRCREWL